LQVALVGRNGDKAVMRANSRISTCGSISELALASEVMGEFYMSRAACLVKNEDLRGR
jgi:hypothetical protein